MLEELCRELPSSVPSATALAAAAVRGNVDTDTGAGWAGQRRVHKLSQHSIYVCTTKENTGKDELSPGPRRTFIASLCCGAREVRWGSTRTPTCKRQAAVAGYEWYSPSFSHTSIIWCRNPDEDIWRGLQCQKASLTGWGGSSSPGRDRASPCAKARCQSSSPSRRSARKPSPQSRLSPPSPNFCIWAERAALLCPGRGDTSPYSRGAWLVQTQSELPLKGARLKLSPAKTQLWLSWAEKLLVGENGGSCGWL